MQYEVGKWYWFVAGQVKWIARFSYMNGSYFYYSESYTICGTAEFDDWCDNSSNKGLAHPSQIEQCLKAYAEKNGYVEGVIVRPPVQDYRILIEGGFFKYYPYCDGFGTGEANIYYKGKWAEIINHQVPDSKNMMEPSPKSSLTQEAEATQIKAKLVKEFTEFVSTEALRLFYTIGLKSHIKTSVYNEPTDEYFELSFKKIDKGIVVSNRQIIKADSVCFAQWICDMGYKSTPSNSDDVCWTLTQAGNLIESLSTDELYEKFDKMRLNG